MVEVQIPKDVSGYETPFLGPLTARQTVCVTLTTVVEYIYYNVMKYLNIGLDVNSLVCIGIVIAVPILYFAIGKPYGMRPEVYIYNYLLPSLLSPKDRPYQTHLTYDSIIEMVEQQESAFETSGQLKKDDKKIKNKRKTQKRHVSKQDSMYA